MTALDLTNPGAEQCRAPREAGGYESHAACLPTEAPPAARRGRIELDHLGRVSAALSIARYEPGSVIAAVIASPLTDPVVRAELPRAAERVRAMRKRKR